MNKCLLCLSALGKHPWKNKDFIKSHRKHTSKCLLCLSPLDRHPWPNKDLIKRHCKNLHDLAAQGKHPFQDKDSIKHHCENLHVLAAQGKLPFHDKDYRESIEENRKKRHAEKEGERLAKGIHNFQTDNP